MNIDNKLSDLSKNNHVEEYKEMYLNIMNDTQKNLGRLASGIGFIVFIGCIATGILLSTLLPDVDSTCSIDVLNCSPTLQKAESEILYSCKAVYNDVSKVNSDNLNQCLFDYIVREEVGLETKSVALLISLTMGVPLVLFALGRHYIISLIKPKLIYIFHKPAKEFPELQYSKYVTLSVICYILSFILYSLSIWRLFETDYVSMSILALVVGFIALIGSHLYATYIQAYLDHALQLQKYDNGEIRVDQIDGRSSPPRSILNKSPGSKYAAQPGAYPPPPLR